MKKLGILALSLGMVAIGHSQTNDVSPSNIAFRLGVGYPLDDATRRLTKNMIGVGADVFFTQQYLKGSDTFVSLDWLGKSGSGAKGNIFPIMLNQRWYSGTTNKFGGRTYYHVGIGIAVVDVTQSKSTLGGRVGLGMEFGPKIFGEANFVFSDNANGAKANGIGIYIGYRF